MRTVEDGSGRRYLLVKRSAESSLVRDAETGRERHLPNQELSVVEGADPLVTAARAVVDPDVQSVAGISDPRVLGFLVVLSRRGPRSVRTILDGSTLCESDLHGLTGELRAAGLIEETTVDGERGYRLTEAGASTVADLQSAGSVG